MKTMKNQATSQSEAIKKARRKLEKRKGKRGMRYTIAMFLATGGMPWMI